MSVSHNCPEFKVEILSTLQQSFVLLQLVRVAELPEVFGLLRDLLPLNQVVSLIRDDLTGLRVELLL